MAADGQSRATGAPSSGQALTRAVHSPAVLAVETRRTSGQSLTAGSRTSCTASCRRPPSQSKRCARQSMRSGVAHAPLGVPVGEDAPTRPSTGSMRWEAWLRGGERQVDGLGPGDARTGRSRRWKGKFEEKRTRGGRPGCARGGPRGGRGVGGTHANEKLWSMVAAFSTESCAMGFFHRIPISGGSGKGALTTSANALARREKAPGSARAHSGWSRAATTLLQSILQLRDGSHI